MENKPEWRKTDEEIQKTLDELSEKLTFIEEKCRFPVNISFEDPIQVDVKVDF